MVMGRPPKPVEEKRRIGNPGRRPLPEPVAYLAPVTEVPKPPTGLRAGGKRQWCQIHEAARVWVNAGLDAGMVERVCRLWDEMDRLRREVEKHGYLLEEPITAGQQGKIVGTRLVANPAVRMLRDAEKQWQSMMSDLCIPPAARARLGLVQVKAAAEKSKLEQIFDRRRSSG